MSRPSSIALERRFTLTEYESPTSPTSIPFASLVEDESLELLGRYSWSCHGARLLHARVAWEWNWMRLIYILPLFWHWSSYTPSLFIPSQNFLNCPIHSQQRFFLLKSSGAVIEEASIAAGRQWLVLVVAIATWINTCGGFLVGSSSLVLSCSCWLLGLLYVVVVCCDLSGFVTVCRSSPASCPRRVLWLWW